MSLILNIDTSLETASVGISRDGKILDYLENTVQKEHATFLHVAVNKILEKQQIKPNALDAIAVTIGPGSYTGLRIGLAAAKGICYALHKPLITVGTLEAMATSVIMEMPNADEFLYCPMIDARRMEVFTAIYNSNLHEIMPPSAIILSPQSFSDVAKKKNIYYFGSGMEKWESINKNENSFYVQLKNLYNALNAISYQKFSNSQFSNTSYTAPLYVKEFHNP